jgi:hypothetical protein
MDDELTQDQLGLIACAIRHPGFPPKPEYLPDCERLVTRGWLDRQLTDEFVTFRLSRAGVMALELGGAVDEATASTN